MEEAQAFPSYIIDKESKRAKLTESVDLVKQTSCSWIKRYKRFVEIFIYTLFVVCGCATATLLLRLYYAEGGKSKWLGSLVQTAGFPVLLPLLCITSKKYENQQVTRNQPSPLILASIYLSLGLLSGLNCLMASIGLTHLPVSTFSVISASQLGFNALFSIFLIGQKFTPYTVNSIVLLAISAILLVFQDDSVDSVEVSKNNYAIGFVCTVIAAASGGLFLASTQLVFQKVIKKESFGVILNLTFYTNLVSTGFILVGLFASGEWNDLRRENKDYRLGNASYVMTLFWAAVTFQAISIGLMGLICKVSALFANVIGMLSLPVAPIAAVFIFNDKMNGVKVMAMILAIWGSASYIYQHYVDDKMKIKTQELEIPNDMSLLSS